MEMHLSVAKSLSKLLDSEFKILGFRVGLDPLIGLIPWIGDFISLMLSLYILWIAFNLKIPKDVISQMVGNVIIDFLLGTIPVVGDISDFFYKANKKNMDLLLKHAHSPVIEGKVI